MFIIIVINKIIINLTITMTNFIVIIIIFLAFKLWLTYSILMYLLKAKK